jgi:hypothetical protein
MGIDRMMTMLRWIRCCRSAPSGAQLLRVLGVACHLAFLLLLCKMFLLLQDSAAPPKMIMVVMMRVVIMGGRGRSGRGGWNRSGSHC